MRKMDRSQAAVLNVYRKVFPLSVISFDSETGSRTMTYSGLRIYGAMSEKYRNELIGRRSYVIFSHDMKRHEDDNEEKVKIAASRFINEFIKIEKENGPKANNF